MRTSKDLNLSGQTQPGAVNYTVKTCFLILTPGFQFMPIVSSSATGPPSSTFFALFFPLTLFLWIFIHFYIAFRVACKKEQSMLFTNKQHYLYCNSAKKTVVFLFQEVYQQHITLISNVICDTMTAQQKMHDEQ